MALRTRKPTGLPPWPLIVVEGGQKTGKTYSTALLSADARIGQMYWLDIGEGAGDQYGALAGVDYDIIEHNGTYAQILQAVRDVTALEVDLACPPVFVGDSITNLWTLLKNEAQAAAEAKGKMDDNGEYPITMNLWNTAARKWRAVMDLLMEWPGLVILTARGHETAMVVNGKPVTGQKDYAIEAHKTLGSDADVIVRVLKPGVAKVTGARTIESGVLDAEMKDWSLSELIFDRLALGNAMGVRMNAKLAEQGLVANHIAKREVLAACNGHQITAGKAWAEAGFPNDDVVGRDDLDALLANIEERKAKAAAEKAKNEAAKNAEVVIEGEETPEATPFPGSLRSDAQRKRIVILGKELGLSDEQRHEICEAACGVSSTKEMTSEEAARVIEHLTGMKDSESTEPDPYAVESEPEAGAA